MEFTRSQTVAFSGHRGFKMGTENPDSIARRVSESLSKLYTTGCRTFLCGMAEGFDLICGAEVLKLKSEHPDVRLVAVIPYPGQASAFPAEAAALHSDILRRADQTIILAPVYDRRCFHRRNDFLLKNSYTLVCYFNGTPGGTRYCFERAIAMGLTVENLCGDIPVEGKLF